MRIGKVFSLLVISLLLFSGKEKDMNKPLFLMLEMKNWEAYQSDPVGEYNHDELIEPLTLQLMTHEGQAEFYVSNVRTTVCDDEVCEIMHIKLFWDLVGNYIGYDTVPGHPLTKFDHEPFTSEDYDKLHELLSNDGSILKFKTKEELIDKEKVKASDVVDGTTGATAVEIKEEVVEGALYTSYTIWHLAYKGDIKNKLTAHTEEVYNDGLEEQFISSGRSGYEIFALKKFTEEDFKEYRPFLLKSMKDGIPLLRKFILNDMPDRLWREEEIQTQVCGIFALLDVNSKTLLLDKLKETEKIHLQSLELLSQEIKGMNKNQLISYLEVLNEQKALNKMIISLVKAASEDNHFQYAHLIYDHAEEVLRLD